MTNHRPTPLALFPIAVFCMLWAHAASAEYVSEEMCVIPWGDGPGELKMGKPQIGNSTYPLGDSGDFEEDRRWSGPEQAFVDRRENLYFISSLYQQFKGFSGNGRLIFDYSTNGDGYNEEFYGEYPWGIYVDSLCRIYMYDGSTNYIIVADTNGGIIEKLKPSRGIYFGEGAPTISRDAKIVELWRGYRDYLTIKFSDGFYYLYTNGQNIEGGSWGWFAKDLFYHYADMAAPGELHFTKAQYFGMWGARNQFYETTVQLNNTTAFNKFLGVDDNMGIYVLLIAEDSAFNEVAVFDTSYSIVDKISVPKDEDRYWQYLPPHMRPSDGNVYEFRCLDDGLHVVRWRRK